MQKKRRNKIRNPHSPIRYYLGEAGKKYYSKYNLRTCSYDIFQHLYKTLDEKANANNWHGILAMYLECHEDKQEEYLKNHDYYKYLNEAEKWVDKIERIYFKKNI